jgi:hypothetical protein
VNSATRRRIVLEREQARIILRRLKRHGIISVPAGDNARLLTMDRFQRASPDPADRAVWEQAAALGKPITMTAGPRQRRALRLVAHIRPRRKARFSLPPYDSLFHTAGDNYRALLKIITSPTPEGPGPTAIAALAIRHARCVRKLSWRGVARWWTSQPRGRLSFDARKWAGNQPLGMALCEAAATKLNEDWKRSPWN